MTNFNFLLCYIFMKDFDIEIVEFNFQPILSLFVVFFAIFFFLSPGMSFSFLQLYTCSDIICDFFANYFICSYWCSFCFYCRYVVSYLASHKLATFLDRNQLFAAKYHFNSLFFVCRSKIKILLFLLPKSVKKIQLIGIFTCI